MTASIEATVDQAWLRFQDRFVAETPRSRALTERAKAVLPGGSTRTVGWFAPYPMVFERGSGPYLFDADGREYIDLFCNGLSLIHGHAYAPVVEVAERVLRSGTAWPGTSEHQIAFAELLSSRIPSHGLVRFANTGTEASMLAVKLARAFTGRQSVLKTWAGYHGSYDVLEAGLHGQGEDPGRARLGVFNDLASFERAFAEHGTEIAAVILESVMYTGVVTAADREFLIGAQELAHRNGALFILDDCLMFRLAEGGSAQHFGVEADLTMLGKFIGGGTPVGAVVGRPDIVGRLDPNRTDRVYHGGSFNGNVLGTACGTVAVRDLTASVIAAMERRALNIRAALEAAAVKLGLPLVTTGIGSAFGVYLSATVPSPTGPRQDLAMSRLFHLAAIRRGVLIGDGNEFALSSVVDDDVTTDAIHRLTTALDDVANELNILN
ncbi:aspartate aminotransferase family protein [Mycolicibacterium komossense]|uniref:Aminotransferase class III-fold pyridoxal phosphate-dependent enzyme n=1 Tax=Mycolicibacterium komossense TaxID=1779 RepID=A0ABT3C9P7_9MYCO|nr:aminotransferase class III-fold pyridoxal phosphate-dependent enzyme [Mycolicibacterium komossense]MCV7226160.1 aminotransferase class III-fold pyridoxal phosphate-dependent enzyme [Mycolicibacterium komossense]